jgi:hypothetical protein
MAGRAPAHLRVLPRLAAIWATFHRYSEHLGAITRTVVRQSG